MKLLCITAFVVISALIGNAHASPTNNPLWVDLPQPDGSVFYCNLMLATKITIYGDQVTAENSISPAQAVTQAVVYLREKNHETAQKVLKTLQGAPERWLEITGPPAEAHFFVNLEAVATVTFGSDKNGDFARVTLRTESVAIVTGGPDGLGLYEKLDQGHEVRDSASIQRLKNIVVRH